MKSNPTRYSPLEHKPVYGDNEFHHSIIAFMYPVVSKVTNTHIPSCSYISKEST